jgi:uncharacterized protein (TIGR00369 family)
VEEKDDIPEGYSYEPTASAFVNHVGRLFMRLETLSNGTIQIVSAMRVEPHHVNVWGFAHGGLIAFLAECVTSGAAYEPEGKPVVGVQCNLQLIRAPKLGELIEMRGSVVRRARTLVFTEGRGEVDGKVVFTATSVLAVVGG